MTADPPGPPDESPKGEKPPGELVHEVSEELVGEVVDEATKRAVRVVESRLEISSHQGPLPPPETLAQYESLVPGTAEKIIGWVDDEIKHRHDLQRVSVHASITVAKRGQIIAAGIAVLAIAAGTILILTDHATTGLVAMFSVLTPILAAFLWGQFGPDDDDDLPAEPDNGQDAE